MTRTLDYPTVNLNRVKVNCMITMRVCLRQRESNRLTDRQTDKWTNIMAIWLVLWTHRALQIQRKPQIDAKIWWASLRYSGRHLLGLSSRFWNGPELQSYVARGINFYSQWAISIIWNSWCQQFKLVISLKINVVCPMARGIKFD